MPRGPAIPLEIQAEVQKLVEEFNHKNFSKASPLLKLIPGINLKSGFAARFKGKFLYLDRIERGRPSSICRLTRTGSTDKWAFAIYKYSDNHTVRNISVCWRAWVAIDLKKTQQSLLRHEKGD